MLCINSDRLGNVEDFCCKFCTFYLLFSTMVCFPCSDIFGACWCYQCLNNTNDGLYRQQLKIDVYILKYNVLAGKYDVILT